MVKKKANSTSDRTTTTNMGSLEHLEYPIPPPGLCYCLCGCGELRFITDEYGRETGFVNGHQHRGKYAYLFGLLGDSNPHTKDMSNRKCSICHTDRTPLRPADGKKHKTSRPIWYIKDGNIICMKCWQREVLWKRPKRKLSHKKCMREQYRKKHNVPSERYRV